MSDVTVVNAENFKQYVDEQLGVPPAPTPEEVAAAETARAEQEKADKEAEAKKIEEDPTHELGETVHKDKKSKINERFSELTAKRKEAEAKAAAEAEARAKYESEAKSLREERERLAKERDELKAKYEPVKTEPDPKPKAADFYNADEYEKALEEWTRDKVIRETAKAAEEKKVKDEAARLANDWQSRINKGKEVHADFEEKLGRLVLPNAVLDAIMRSDIGDEVAYAIANEEGLAEKIRNMPLSRAVVEVGKIEGRLEKAKETPPEKKVEVSKAPAPITPIRTGGSSSTVQRDENGNFAGSYDEWKAARQAGRIK